ncbi:MAG: MarR family EPS-associated transcriptional regulator [Desulfobacterales bacterium]|nr:MarR family EPS-associated transcriptional regulator [Desulfobacterales bacterium]
MTEESSYRIVKILEANPRVSQRELARGLGISLGKVNYCLKGLINKGIIKAKRFRNSDNKLTYAYVLTPRGIEARSKLTARYLKRRLKEYEKLKLEIEMLQDEVNKTP